MNINDFKPSCIKQQEDPRDHKFRAKLTHWTKLNDIDLRPGCRTPRKQGNIASCTAFAATALYDFIRRKHNSANWLPSPLFTYYTTRMLSNTEHEDVGATIKDAMKSTAQYGVCKERVWPYDESKFDVKPPDEAFTVAENHQTLEYLKINDYDKSEWLNCLNDGYPFAFGLNLYTTFFDPIMQLMGGFMVEPDRENEKLIGAHCMLAVGYIKNYNKKDYLIVQNSWGKNWGDNGYCYIPISYIMSNDSFDFWTIRLTETSAEDTDDPTAAPTQAPTSAPTPAPTTAPTQAPTAAPTQPPVVITPTQAPLAVQPTEEKPNSKHKIMFYAVIAVTVIFVLVWLFA